jgi:hypothetical protein
VPTLPSLTLVGTFLGTDGQVTFTPNAELTDLNGDVILPQVPILALVRNGSFSVNLLPCDAAGVMQTGWAYDVVENISYLGPLSRQNTNVTYTVQPTGTGTVNLASLAHYDPPPVIQTYLAITGGTVTGDLAVTGATTLSGGETLLGATGTTTVFQTFVLGDTQPRTKLNAGGGYLFGSGSAPTDTDLYRADAGVLATDGVLLINVVSGSPSQSSIGQHSLLLTSTFAGNENTFDSTGRLDLESYQRAQMTNPSGSYASYGEVLRIFSRRWDSKQMVAWYGPTGYDVNGNPAAPDTTWFWMGAHYEANDHLSVHGHWSVEVPDSTGQMQTRMEFRIWDPTTGAFGMDRTIAKFNAADVIVAQDNGALWMAAAAGTTKTCTSRTTCLP